MTIQNEINITGLGDTTLLFWDGRENSLPAMVIDPLVNGTEMGNTDINAVVLRLSGLPDYQTLFQNAYGNSMVTKEGIGQALAVFLYNFQSRNSRFDASQNGGLQLQTNEQNGHFLFLTKYNCNSCHQVESAPDSLSNYAGKRGFVDIGLDSIIVDLGRSDVTGQSTDVGKFKIPSLRNIALSAPYMHDGRFKTLSEVIDHYSSGIVNHPNLDVRLKDGTSALRMNISDEEKQDLIAFLNTLTDQQMLTDLKLSDPFSAN